MTSDPDPQTDRELFESHGRDFQSNLYVYPVLSRRSAGISIGVNLSRDKVCNFKCIYCQVDHSRPGRREVIDLERLGDELDRVVELVVSQRIYQGPRFSKASPELRRLNDIALSGDGEPTMSKDFGPVVDVCAAVRRRHRLDDVKLVLITNATMLHREPVRQALLTLDASNGEIWAKLDAGSEAYYRRVSRSAVPLQRVLDNITQAAQARPIVIQSLFMQIDGLPAPPTEIEAYCDRLRAITAAGGRIKLVQVHTVARAPAESNVSALSNTQVDALADQVGQLTGLAVARYYG